jgi:hypothetical protein
MPPDLLDLQGVWTGQLHDLPPVRTGLPASPAPSAPHGRDASLTSSMRSRGANVSSPSRTEHHVQGQSEGSGEAGEESPAPDDIRNLRTAQAIGSTRGGGNHQAVWRTQSGRLCDSPR